MKLYTELEIKKAISFIIGEKSITESILAKLNPIELPSDREIENNAYTDRRVNDWEHDQQIGFERGAKWMKEQILNQNK